MADSSAKQILAQSAEPRRQGPKAPASFDEQGYLRANPDVAEAVRAGRMASGFDHYRDYGAREGRPLRLGAGDPRGALVAAKPWPTAAASTPAFAANTLDGLFASPAGGVMIVGWIDDRDDPVDCICVAGPDWRVTFDGPGLARIRRADVEESLGQPAPHPFGYFGLVFGGQPISAKGDCQVEIRHASGAVISASVRCVAYEIGELRDLALNYLAAAQHFGNPQIGAMGCLESGLGEHVVAMNRDVVRQIVASPYVERISEPGTALIGSIVVCLFGKLEFLFLQAALYAGLAGMEGYEFIYVCNSPELAEPLLAEARIAARLYGLVITVVLLPGNAGFGAANNAAAASARTDRLLFVNPDVFPRDPDWAQKHTSLLQSRPARETQLFGAPLYYDDGSLMHGGMYFEVDTGVTFDGRKNVPWRLLRVEHYGKGAPAAFNPFTRPRPVPAVTGAFMSIERAWFEKLGGFTPDYVFGHYEDADLCLKSLTAGHAPFLHDLRLWHLEGKGSTRLPVHEAGSMVNRWLFTARWGDTCRDGLMGPEPTGLT